MKKTYRKYYRLNTKNVTIVVDATVKDGDATQVENWIKN